MKKDGKTGMRKDGKTGMMETDRAEMDLRMNFRENKERALHHCKALSHNHNLLI